MNSEACGECAGSPRRLERQSHYFIKLQGISPVRVACRAGWLILILLVASPAVRWRK